MIIEYDSHFSLYKNCLYFYYFMKNIIKNSINKLLKIRSHSRDLKIYIIQSSEPTMHRWPNYIQKYLYCYVLSVLPVIHW